MDLLIQELEWGKDNMNKDFEQNKNFNENIDPSMFEFVQKEKKISDYVVFICDCCSNYR